MSNPFAALEVEIDKPSRMPLLDYRTDLPIVDKAGKAAYVEVYSIESESVQRQRRSMQLAQTNAPEKNQINADELDRQRDAEILAAATAGWYLVGLDGNPIDIPCTPDNARMLYANRMTQFIARQVFAHARALRNFAPASSSN